MARFASLAFALLLFLSLSSALSPEHFRAVKASEFALDAQKLDAGSVLSGSVALTNSLDYPLPETSLILQLVQRGEEGAEYVFEEQEAVEGIALAAGASKNVQFLLALPKGLPAGEYELRAYAKSGIFNTGGAPYAEGSAIASAPLAIANDAPDYPLILPPLPAASEPAANGTFSTSFEVLNNGPAGTVVVQYALYYVDVERHSAMQALRDGGIVGSESAPAMAFAAAQVQFDVEAIEFDEGASHVISIRPVEMPPGTYLFEAVATKRETRSRISFQITSGAGAPAMLDFASVLPLPLAQGQEAELLACASPASEGEFVGASVEVMAYAGTSIIVQESAGLTVGAPAACAHIPFTPAHNARLSELRVLLLDEEGGLLDVAAAEFPPDLVSVAGASLLLESSVAGGNVAYHAALTDRNGNPLAGKLELVLKDADGSIVDSALVELTGAADGAFVAPEGGYVLEAGVPAYKLLATSSNSTPYFIELPFDLPVTGEGREGQPPSMPANPFAVLGIVVLLALLVGLGIFAVKNLGGGGRKTEQETDWDNI